MSSTPLCKFAVLLLVAASLQGCGGGDTTPPPGAVPGGQQAQQTLGASGGDVVLYSSDGAVFALSVPAGALPTGTTVTLSTVDATVAQHFQLRLTPQGTMLAAGKLATLTITLPASAPLPAKGGLNYDGVPMPFTRLTDGRLEVKLGSFAGGSAGAAATGHVQALRAQRQAAASAAVCAPQLGGADGSLSAEDAVEIELYGQCMVAAVNALASNGQFADAVRTASATAAYLQATGLGDPAGFIRLASGLACTAYRAALDHAIDTDVTTSFGMLFDISRPVMFWEMTIQRLGATCPNVGITEYQTVINAKTEQALAYFASKKGAITDTNGTEYTEAVAAAQNSHDTTQQVRSLQPPPAVAQVLATQIEQRAQPALVDAILQAPWQRCRDSGNYDELMRLMDLMGQPQNVKDAAQYCATLLQAQSRDSAGGTVDTLAPALGGFSADRRSTSAPLRVNRSGSLVLSGPIRSLQCPAGSTGGTEALLLKIDGTVVQILSTSPYLADALTIDLPTAFSAAHVADTATQATLTVERTGQPCGGYWGSNPVPLLSLNMNLAALPDANVVRVFSLTTVPLPPPDNAPVDTQRCYDLNYVQVRADAATPFTYSAPFANCAFSATMRLTQADGNWVVSADYTSTNTGALINLLFRMTFDRASTVTMTMNPNWRTTSVGCVNYTQSAYSAYLGASYETDFNPGQALLGNLTPVPGGTAAAAPCPQAGSATYQESLTFPVVAGQTVLFGATAVNQAGSISGAGSFATIRVTAAP